MRLWLMLGPALLVQLLQHQARHASTHQREEQLTKLEERNLHTAYC
jgi:hypothetical protein